MPDMEAKTDMVHSAKSIKKPKPRTSGMLSNARIQNMLNTRD
jgi:hypothetical protein